MDTEPVVDESEPVESEAVDEETVAETLPPKPERFVLLARGGPLLVDVTLTIDGRAYDEPIADIVDQVLRAADSDDDGKSTWEEWRENTEFLEGELANLTSMRAKTVRDWIKQYDINEDGRMQRAEAASWLGRDGGRSAGGLRVRSSRSFVASGASRSRLLQILDADDDGRMSAEELKRASQRLLLLDTSDDRIVDATELATLRDQISGQSPRRSSYARQLRRDAAIHLRNARAARDLDYTLSDLYAPRQDLTVSSFPARQRLFQELDADEDGVLDASELEAMVHMGPHVTLRVDFTSQAENEGAAAKLTLIEHADEVESVQQLDDSRLLLVTSDTNLMVSANDLTVGQSDANAVRANQLSLMVHDRGDGLFECLDVDGNGALGEREVAFAAERIGEFDTDDDRQLDGDELPYSLTVAFLRGEQPNERSFYVPPAGDTNSQEVDTPPWFRHADHNGDGDISRSEFLGSLTRFDRLDSNNDQFISAAEAAKNSE